MRSGARPYADRGRGEVGEAATFADIAAALSGSGLIPRGAAVLDAADAPRLASGAPAVVAMLIGHGGGAFFSRFQAWHADNPGVADPLDTWSKAVISPAAHALGGEAVFPSDPPYLPFQRWAMAAEGLKASPLGILMHPKFGLWHGYRGAVLFGEGGFDPAGVALQPLTAHACDGCATKPCLTACPVSAFGPAGFDVVACRTHLGGEAGRAGCMASGCMARAACPVGVEHRYGVAQIRFHMAAFAP